VRIASPVHVDKSQLRPARGEEPLSSSWNHPLPWPGGRWTLRDIVEYDFAAVMACLKHVANDKTSWLRNFYQIGNRAVTSSHNPFAYLIPEQQRDPVTADELCGILRRADVEIHEASQAFSADGNPYPTGTKVVFCRQPYGSFAKTMLEIQRYPDMRQFPGGPPIVPYDVTAHSLPLQMGVDVVEVKSAFHVPTRPAAPACSTKGMVSARSECPRVLLVRPETNISAAAVNMLLAKGVRVSRASEPVQTDNGYYPAGTFMIEAGEDALTLAEQIAARCSLRVDVIRDVPKVSAYTLCRPRIGVYQSYVASADEGWTRFVLEQYGFEYETILDEDVRAGGLQKRFDCVLLPHQTLRHLHQGHDAAYYAPQYAGGLGDEGAESLRAFVESGGTLIAWDGSSRYAIQHLDLPVSNVLAGLPSSSFFAPGSLLRVLLDTTHPVAYGMPDPAAVMFVNSPAFEVREGRVIGRYPLHNPLRSGLLIGADKLFGKCAVASIPVGQGRVVLIGFRVHFRAQARGTYKLLFNSIFLSAALE
jgi:hypothetical protein